MQQYTNPRIQPASFFFSKYIDLRENHYSALSWSNTPHIQDPFIYHVIYILSLSLKATSLRCYTYQIIFIKIQICFMKRWISRHRCLRSYSGVLSWLHISMTFVLNHITTSTYNATAVSGCNQQKFLHVLHKEPPSCLCHWNSHVCKVNTE